MVWGIIIVVGIIIAFLAYTGILSAIIDFIGFLFSIIQFIVYIVIAGLIIFFIASFLSDSTAEIVVNIILVIATLAGIGLLIYFISAVFGNFESNTSQQQNEIDTSKRHEKDPHDSISRSCATCRYYESGYGNCSFNRENSVTPMNSRKYICDHYYPE